MASVRDDIRRPDVGALSRGFTLLEVLVVVAVIALLVAVLLPSLHKARHHSRRVTCQSHLKELAIAWRYYLDDHQGAFLQDARRVIRNTSINYGGKHGESPFFRGNAESKKPLNRYAGVPPKTTTGADVFQCPGDDGDPGDFGYYGTSYQMNRMLVGNGKLQVGQSDPCHDVLDRVSDRLPDLNRSKVARESRLLLMGDFRWDTAYQWAFDTFGTDWHGRDQYYNMAYLDGHVEFVHIRKGLHTTEQYTVIPFKREQIEVCAYQVEKTPE